MEQSVINFFMTQGPWALLFVLLLYWVLKENSKRETRLIECLESLDEKYKDIYNNLDEIKEGIKDISRRC